jgi:hypothetical protein
MPLSLFCCTELLPDKAPTSMCASRTSILAVEFEAEVPQLDVLVARALGPPLICNHLVDGIVPPATCWCACVCKCVCCIFLSVSTCVCMSAHARSLSCARTSLLACVCSHVCVHLLHSCVRTSKSRPKLGTCHALPNSSHISQV